MPLLVSFRSRAIMMVMVCGFLGLLASTAKADSYLINNPNPGLAGSPAPYGIVTLTRVTANQGSTNCALGCINVDVQMGTNSAGHGIDWGCITNSPPQKCAEVKYALI